MGTALRQLLGGLPLSLLLCAVLSVASPAQSFNTLVNFAGPNGAEPRYGSLIQAADGNFYGTTRGGGAHSRGTVFKLTPSGTLTTLYSFCSLSNCSDGSDPDGGLALGSDGNFYGTTTAGGSNHGTVFKITPSGTLTTLHNFNGIGDGDGPNATLLLASDGNFYGITQAEGPHGSGTVFRITSGGALTTVYSFCSVGICTDGATPFGGLTQGRDGYLYGTTSNGGAHTVYGTVFKLTTGGTLTTLHSFAGSDGSAPYGRLVQAGDNYFYGTTSSGGTSHNCSFGCGTAFKISSAGNFTSLHNFTFTDGSYVTAGLIQASVDGNFYGAAGYGGSTQHCHDGCGTLFKMTPSGTVTTLHNFAGYSTEGSLPVAGLLEASNHVFYGATEAGGSVGDGSVFSLAVFLIPTTTVVTSVPNPSQAGDLVTITATVSPSGASGTVSFTSNGTAIAGCTAVPLASSMAVCMTSSLAVGTDTIMGIYSGDSNYSGSSGMVSQIVNPVPTPVQFVPITPCRIVDTRNSNGTFGGPILTGHSTRSFPLTEADNPCEIPPEAVAYSLNVAVVPTHTLSYLTIWPTGQGQPLVATLNSYDGRVKSNAAIVPAGASSGAVSVYVTDTTHVILDINGYFMPADASTLAFYPLAPCRVVDTRDMHLPQGLGPPHFSSRETRELPFPASSCLLGIHNAKAYSINVAVVPNPSGTRLDYLTAFPSDQQRPVVATLNNPTATVVANAAIVPAAANGDVSVYVTNSTDVIIDINGYFAAPGQGGLSFYPVTPCRVFDSRANNGQPFTHMLTPPVDVVHSPCGPPNTPAYVLNAVVVPYHGGPVGYLTLWEAGQPRPQAANLNAYDGAVTSNMAIVPTTNGMIDAYADGTTHLILDISGYFAP